MWKRRGVRRPCVKDRLQGKSEVLRRQYQFPREDPIAWLSFAPLRPDPVGALVLQEGSETERTFRKQVR
jgi:hypothetical protein